MASIGKEIDSFTISLILNSSSIPGELKKLEKDIEKGVKVTEAQVERLKDKVETLTMTTKLWVRGFYAFTASMGVAFYQYTKEAEAFGQTAKEIGLNVERLDALEKATIRAGGKAGDFTNSIKKLNDALTQTAIEGTSDLSQKLEEQGINGGEQGYKRNAYNVFLDIAKRAKEMGDIEGSYWLKSLGFSAGEIELLKKGDDEIRDIIHDMKALGVVNDQDAKLAKGFNDGMRDLWDSFRGVANVIIRMVLPPLNKFLKVGAEIFNSLKRHERFVQAFFIGIAAVIMNYAIPAFIILAKMMLANPITQLMLLLVGIALVLEDLLVWADEGESAFEGLWEAMFGSPKELQTTFENIKNWCAETIDYMIKKWEQIKKTVPDVINMWKELFAGFFDWLKEKFDWFFNAAEKGAKITGNAKTMDYSNENGVDEIPSTQSNGGIFTSPTNALIGEAGGEAVIPFSPGKKNRGLELLSKIAGNFMDISAAQALPMGGATTNNITTDTRVNVGTVNISAADGTDAANQFMSGIESRASAWTAAANVAY